MTDERYSELMNDDSTELTHDEIKEGWHFCPEMDGLLANPNIPDGDCFCEMNKSRIVPN
jgi:hypothetical protein